MRQERVFACRSATLGVGSELYSLCGAGNDPVPLSEATVDVGAWLKNLGLGQYEAAFRDNAIDGDVLPSLTAEDLKDLGVTIVGHRRRLLDTIAALGAAAPKAEPPPAAPTAPPPSPAPPRTADSAAERRPVTVLFCDLVGSTSLAAAMDAEDWRDLVGGYLDAASEAVAQYGGHVLKKLGDGIMALFGYPRAQENDAERAARAALAILAAIEALNAKNAGGGSRALAARIGLDTGLIVVDATGEVFGEAPNVAARAQSLADPGHVLVTAAVQRQIAGLFVAEDKGAHALKGVPAPVALYGIVRASGGGRRGGARALTPFVGREEDLALLMRRWERARGGGGQFVQIVGEPGLGKSRLVEEFRARLGETPHTWVEWAASQLLQNTPLHPLAEWGRLRFGGSEIAADKRLADLEQVLTLVKLDASENAALLAPLVDIPLPESRSLQLAPEELRRRQLAAVAAWILAGARAQAIVLAVEDLHWADPTTLDLMKSLAERGASAPLLIVATARPEFRAPWTTRSHHGVASLVPLDRAEIRRMVGAIAERHALSIEVQDGVADRTGGVPLFVEEVTRLLLERGETGGAQAIPPTLQQSLAARLDRLGEVREVAQIGAVLGREFSYGLLRSVAAVHRASEETPVSRRAMDRGGGVADPALQSARGGGLSEAALQSALEKLAEADLLFVEGHAPQATYRFKHALIQDAAYESLLKSRRQALHRRAAEALVASPDPQPELVAHHFTQAGETELAIEWWGKAGDAALRRSAFQEAIAHLGKAIAMVDKGGHKAKQAEIAEAQALLTALGEADEVKAAETQRRRRLHLQTAYGQAVMWAKGFAAEETRAAYSHATELAAKADSFADRFAAAHVEWTLAFVRGELRAARELESSFLKEAEDTGRILEAGVARRGLALACYQAGDFLAARAHCERALEACDLERDRETQARFHDATGPIVLSVLAVTMWQLGGAGRARELIDQATGRASELGHALSMAQPLLWRTVLEFLRRDHAATVRAAEALGDLGRELGTPFWRIKARQYEGWARGRLHDAAAGAAEFRRALADVVEQGATGGLWTAHGMLAELEAETLGADAALARIDEAGALARRDECRCNLASLDLLRGEFLLKRHPPDHARAEEAFQTAIAIAKGQGARSWGLRAALSLAKFYQSTGRPVEAHAVLAPALEGFAPTPEMPEIAEAEELMSRLW